MYGVPLVAYDGTAGGVTRDGKRLLLETAGTSTRTRFAVLSTLNLKVQQSFALPGLWAYDALSPDGKTVFLTQVTATDPLRYLVRAYDLSARRLVAGAIVDKQEPEAMTGYPGQPRRERRTGSGRTRSTHARAPSRSSTR